ncbi:MAG: SDR family NAD(P)-dependent oxidoreductase, partial [Alphaproteobacteria bacterium]
MRLKDKVTVITGGARGIGVAYARRFVAEGSRVVIADVLDREGEAAAAELSRAGGAARYVHCDVTRKAQVDALMDSAVSAFGRLDVAIANAGVLDHGDFLDVTEESFDRVMAVNVKGAFLTGQAAARRMIACGRGGVIINIASTVAVLGEPSEGAYPTSKGAVNLLTRVMAVSLADHGIRVVAIGPGATRTPMMAGPLADPERRRIIEARTPLRRPAEPEEMAGVAAFLASEDASYITGQTIYVDGGRLVLNY